MIETMCGSEHNFESRCDMLEARQPDCKGGRYPLQGRSRKQWVPVNTQEDARLPEHGTLARENALASGLSP
jgi:hypothetical protein